MGLIPHAPPGHPYKPPPIWMLVIDGLAFGLTPMLLAAIIIYWTWVNWNPPC